MSSKITLGFLAALALLAVLVLGLERFNVGQPPDTAAAKDQELAMFQFDDRTATAFVVRSGDKTVRLEKDGESWKIAESGEPANRLSISSLLIRLASLKGTKRVGDTGGDLAQFGLAEPKLEATVELADGTKPQLLLGDRTPTGSGVYAKKPDAPDVFVVATQIASDLERLAADPKEPATPTPVASPSPAAEPSPTP